MEIPPRSYDLYSYFDLIQLFRKKHGLFQLCYLPFRITFLKRSTSNSPPPPKKKTNLSDSSRRRQKGTRCNWLQVASLASEPSVEGMHVAEHRLGENLHGKSGVCRGGWGWLWVVPMPRKLNIQQKKTVFWTIHLENLAFFQETKYAKVSLAHTCTNKMNFPSSSPTIAMQM